MPRPPAIRPTTYAAMVGFGLIAIGVIWILCEVDTKELGTAEYRFLAIVVGSQILCAIGWLVLWRQSHSRRAASLLRSRRKSASSTPHSITCPRAS